MVTKLQAVGFACIVAGSSVLGLVVRQEFRHPWPDS